ncbi:variable surface lipoprotein [Mycoplasmopsis agalactiae]|uniref:variable surface lipoprotein n=1 Tax=Mycoplasmopsis agalactiae TaxID=2110 RepID=UPI00030220D5|nr:variable surface lipoprotein [Mycoplasmopsis agalactiae]
MKKVKKLMLLFGSAVSLSSLSVVAAKCEDTNNVNMADGENKMAEESKNDMGEKMENLQNGELKTESNTELEKNQNDSENINGGGKKIEKVLARF